MTPQIQNFIETVKIACYVTESQLLWKDKYEIVFGSLMGKIEETGVEVDWCDPDMDYEDDVLAYVGALKEKARELGGNL